MGKPRGGHMVVRKPDLVLTPASAFAPERLDGPVQEALGSLEEAMAAHRAFAPMLGQVMGRLQEACSAYEAGEAPSSDQAHQLAHSVTTMLERQARTTANMAKVVDLVARLRTFLAGGTPETPELAGKSDAELEEMVVAMALATGRVVRA